MSAEMQGALPFANPHLRAEPFRAIATETFRSEPDGRQLVRMVALRHGGSALSKVEAAPGALGERDLRAAFDASWLRSAARPVHASARGRVRVIDLFSGCGGLTLGLTEACRALELGIEHVFVGDSNLAALDVYKRNFPAQFSSYRPLESLVGEVDSPITAEERAFRAELGPIDVLAGGPPCQGNSDLNNHTRRKDPKNALFLTMIRFAQILSPTHVIIENVPGVRHDRGAVTAVARRTLEASGYSVHECLLDAATLGVPQRRRRYMMIATRRAFSIGALARVAPERTLRWACSDVMNDSGTMLDSQASPSRANRERINYLFDHDLYDLPNEQRPACHRLKAHSYVSVYGRLRWDEPAPTITSGFNSPGQGRFVHPAERRTLTPHEAARLQFIPDFFDWGTTKRENLMMMIGNAVPPKLSYAVGLELLR